MQLIGVDPGCSGALVLLEDGQPIEWMLMPTLKVGSATRVNASAVHEWMFRSNAVHAYIEQVHAMPGQGVTSMFSFGHACGVLSGVVAALGLPHTLVTPQAWKKAAGLIGTDKDAARSRAIQLWPAWKELNKKGAGQALADAALIARFGK